MKKDNLRAILAVGCFVFGAIVAVYTGGLGLLVAIGLFWASGRFTDHVGQE